VFDERVRLLLEERLRPGADRDAVDARLWEVCGEEWCIMATDLSGFSRGVAELGIVHFLQTIHESSRILIPVVEHHQGVLLKMEGDSFLAIFADVQQGLRAAMEMQRTTRHYNEGRPAEEHVLLGVGLGFGRVLRVAPEEVYGNEVNSACILGETYAKPYDILVTQAVRDAAEGVEFEEFPHVPPGARGAYRVV
jgi:class 3 adenylate cyclase